MEITVRVEVQYLAPENAIVMDVLQMFRRPMWVRFMMRYISPRLKNASPADKSVLESLESEWLLGAHSHEDAPSSDCSICLANTPRPAISHVRLPCGHGFHLHCMHSWFQVQSTCPNCRFQFRKAFAGTYAVHTLTSTVLLREEDLSMTRDQVMRTSVEKQHVRAVVDVTLVKVISEEKQKEYPCELIAQVMHVDGECFSEYDVFPVAANDSGCDSTIPAQGDLAQTGTVRSLENDRVDEEQHFKRLRRL